MKQLKIKSEHVQGILEPDCSRRYPFQRFPQKYKKNVRQEVWDLSENSAGVCLSFSTNSSNLFVSWILKHRFKMRHMTDVGISGLDLYQKKGHNWHFVSTVIPKALKNENYFFKGFKKKLRHFRVYLPLYNTLTDLELGIDSNSEFHFSYNHKVPLVFYGTSITQGGCASRPGLAYTNIISRKLNRVCINLGFSGNGHLETSIGGILSNLRNAIFIIDCMWNIEKRIISENTKSFINTIRSKINNLDLPIIFYEQYILNEDHPDKKLIQSIVEKNAILRKQIDIQINEGIKNLYLFRQDGCINKDSEATIDGVHFNDLGFVRYSNHFIYHFKKLNLESHS